MLLPNRRRLAPILAGAEVVHLLAAYLGYFIGYGSIALVSFSFAFVLAKTLKKTWPYKGALTITLLFYVVIAIGLNHANRGN